MMLHSPALVFLSDAKIPDAFDELKLLIPNEARYVVNWFEENYVHGRVRNLQNSNIDTLQFFFLMNDQYLRMLKWVFRENRIKSRLGIEDGKL